MVSPGGCDFNLGSRDENALSGRALENPGPQMLGEAMRPPQECVQPVLGGTLDQSSSRKVSEKRCPPSVPEQEESWGECGESDMGEASELYYPPAPHELSAASLSDPPNIDNSPALDLRHQNQRRAPLMEKPRRRTKAKAKAKADRRGSVNVDASKEDIALGK